MKNKLWIALISIALLCLLCGAASAVPGTTDDGCWSISEGTEENTVFLTDFYAEADTGHKYLISDSLNPDVSSVYDCLVFPYTVNAGGVTYIVEGVKNFAVLGSHRLDSGIKRVILSEGITTVGSLAFSTCRNLVSIQLPLTIRIIGDSAFKGCWSLRNLNIPYSEDENGAGSLEYLGDTLFVNTENLNVAFGGTFSQWPAPAGCFEHAPGIRIETADGYSFGWCGDRIGGRNGSTRIWQMTPEGEMTFDGNGDILSPGWDAEAVRVIKIPDMDNLMGLTDADFDRMTGLTAIEQTGFSTLKYFTHGGILYNYGFTSISSSVAYCPLGYTGIVEIPASMTDADFSKFAGRPGITGFSAEQGNNTFFTRDSILYRWKNAEMSDAEPVFCPSAYAGAVQIPAFVSDVNADVFAGRGGITGFTVEEGNPSYTALDGILLNARGNEIILCPPGLRNVTIPAGADTWTGEIFRLISGAFTVTMQSPLQTIPEGAFRGCKGLTSVNIPDSVTGIGEDAFRECRNLISVKIPDSVRDIGYSAFCDCAGLTSVTLPESLTVIPDSLFNCCLRLPDIIIPSAVTAVGSNAFRDCGALKTVVLPESVTALGTQAFEGCNELKDLYYSGTFTQWAEVSIFENAIPDSCAVHTLDDQAARVRVAAAGMTQSDLVTLTDGYGTKTAISSSGSYGFWEKDPEITVTPDAGRRVTYSLSYTRAEDGVTVTQALPGVTSSGSVTIPLDRSLGVPEVTLVFENDNGYTAYHLFVNENILLSAHDSGAPAWLLTCGEERFYNGDTVLIDRDGIGQSKEFRLALQPGDGSWSCAGELIYGSKRILITDAELSYSFTVSGADIHLNLTWFDKNSWQAVTYDGNGSEGSTPARVTAAGSDGIAAENNGFSGQSGSSWFIFNGWNTRADGEGTAYAPGIELPSQPNLTLYAQWIPAWRLAFRENGGEGSMNAVLLPKPGPDDAVKEAAIPLCGFTYPGKTLREWNTRSNGKGTPYAPEAAVPLDSNITLYAIWDDAWTVTADADPAPGGTVTGAGAYRKDTPVTLTAVPAEHYRFVNWTDENGMPVSADAEYTFTPAADCRLTARFERNEYAVAARYCTVRLTDSSAPVAFAEPGTRLSAGWDYENQPKGMYWTGIFSVNGEALPEGENEFTMPEENVTVAAVYRPQESVTIDLSAAPAAVSGDAVYRCGEIRPDEESPVLRMDLNGDGAFDLKLVPAENESGELLVSPLQGMTALSPYCTKDISGEHGRYGTVTFLFELPAFETPADGAGSFVLPLAVTEVRESAFEGDAAIRTADAGGCAAIGAYAFRNCTGLTKIRTDRDCAIHPDAFDGCGIVYVFAPPGGAAEAACAMIENCIFIPAE